MKPKNLRRQPFSGVKVIEENYDETTNLTTTRTLYRGGAAKTEKEKINSRQRQDGLELVPARQRKRLGSVAQNRKKPRKRQTF